MNRVTYARLLPLATIATFAACSGGGGGATAGLSTGGEFVVLKTEPSDNGTLFLNDAIRIDFSNKVNLDSVDLTTFSFVVKDQLGNAVAEPVAGNFSLGASPGDEAVGRRLLFSPRLPTDDLFTTGGFRPGRTYEVQLVGGSRVNGTVLTDQGGRPLAQLRTFRFSTADGTSPSQLFRNVAPGGPRRVALEITPTPDASGVVLNKLGSPAVEVRLKFDQPLNPSSSNVPVLVDTNPLTRNPNNRGRVYLEYDDPEFGLNRWLPADVELERNALDGATVVLRPVGVLPNNANIRVVVERTFEDISGESNFSNAAYDRFFGTFRTKRSYEQQFDSIVDDFVSSASIDLTAAFGEPFAEVGAGYLKAGFDFEGTSTGVEFEPAVPETILNTNFTQVTPKIGAAYNVSGGVFNFRNVKIPTGRTVIGQGSNPMVWLVSGSFEVAGLLSVRGGDGQRVNTSGNANVPKAGGAGVCGGGDGGNGSPSTTSRDSVGATGNGPLQVTGRGGAGGALSCLAGCNRGAGGGGGALATQGDPNFKQKVQAPTGTQPFPILQQQTGQGGNGCSGIGGAVTRQLQGAVPGPTVFVDARNDNNFWGVGVRFDGARLRIAGELAVPIGGGGGGGGGVLSYNTSCNADPTFESDSSGGGGGGGGGVLVVKALGPIIIAEGGRVTADGGNGGGGEPNASSTRGGGGGGGAGGMVVLMSATRIDINARGSSNRYRYAGAENEYEFSISADGGVCTTLTTAPVVTKKYMPTTPTSPTSGDIGTAFATLYDSAPLGGFGGMGIVQLMAPPGTNTDGTNTVLDDNIRMIRAGLVLTGAAKRDLLAWRGFPNQFGQGVDDSGVQTSIGDNEGDIRPAPTLLPAPFGAQTRLRSNWIDTGASKRRRLDFDDNTSRGIVDLSNTLPGPRYEFAGLNQSTGYASYLPGSLARLAYPTVVAPVAIQTSNANSTYLGKPAYRIELVSAALGTDADRYSNYEVELLDATDTQLPAPAVSSFRILSHTDRELVLSTEAGALPSNAAKLRVRAKFFNVTTGDGVNAVEGLGSTYLGAGGARVPIANVRIGFAFHTDPSSATGTRFPATANTFLYNLEDPGVQEQIRALGAAFVQWDILFDTAYKTSGADAPPSLSSDTPRPKLEFLRVPYRF